MTEPVVIVEVTEPVVIIETTDSATEVEVTEPVITVEITESAVTAEVTESVVTAEITESFVTVEVTEPLITVEVIDLAPAVVDITFLGEQGLTGPEGPIGNTGPIGPQGPIGQTGGVIGSISHTHNQEIPLSVWTVNHPLDFTPQVTTVDSSGRVVEGSVEYVSPTQIIITYSAPFSGKAYLS